MSENLSGRDPVIQRKREILFGILNNKVCIALHPTFSNWVCCLLYKVCYCELDC